MIDRCVSCGEIVPEGRMVCPMCESGSIPIRDKEKEIKEQNYECEKM